jgi:hypothetical protein
LAYDFSRCHARDASDGATGESSARLADIPDVEVTGGNIQDVGDVLVSVRREQRYNLPTHWDDVF